MANEELRDLLNSYDDAAYPVGFPSEYTLMECLSDRNGICTFLVQGRDGASYIAKCYDKSVWALTDNRAVWSGLDCGGLPKQIAAFENEKMTVTVREYIEGSPLSRYARENDLSEQEIVGLCVQLCDILGCLHHRDAPIIHRDVKPENVIVRPDGRVALIDFDIARIYRRGHDTDTVFFGTRAYAPPEQYGFSQTDARTDIYSLGVLLRWLLTGSTRENRNIRIYRPLAKIIRKCTGFAPKDRFADVAQVKKALLQANPRAQGLRIAALILCAVLAAGLLGLGGVKAYRAITYDPFANITSPVYLPDEDRVADAVAYMKDKYGTELFDAADDFATVRDLRMVLIDLYGLDRDYVYGYNDGMPEESEGFFLPWGWPDAQSVDRAIAIYAAVKAHDPELVADWSSLGDDTGVYPGVRVAEAFAEKTGIAAGVNHIADITLGELAIVFANADRVFDTAQAQ